MERPKDIPEWAWKKADDAVWEGDAIANNISGFAHELTVVVARAILAAVEEEREACAQECDKESDKWYRYGPHNSAYAAAKAIRARSSNKEQTP